MMILSDYFNNVTFNTVAFVVLCFVLTIGLSVIFDRVICKIDSVIVKV